MIDEKDFTLGKDPDYYWDWESTSLLPSRRYECAYCKNPTRSERGYSSKWLDSNRLDSCDVRIYICTECQGPTLFINAKQFPGELYGGEVENIPELVNASYQEARWCASVGAYTASVMICRKMLMNIAVQKGALEGLKFIKYVEWLDSNHFIPPDGKAWVTHIRDRANEANHEIALMKKEDAELLMSFVEILLRFVYEAPGNLPKKP